MKIYVASSFKLIDRVEEVVEALEERGHEITVKWWKRIYDTEDLGKTDTQKLKALFEDLEPKVFYARPETFASYMADLQGIRDCQAFVLVADKYPRNFGGANIELGFALGLQKTCFSIGKLANSSLYWDVYKSSTIEQLIKDIEDLA